jgi:formylglycine-generating enzyme required for sulfatase activity
MEERFCPAFAALPANDRARFLTAIRAWRFGFGKSPEVWFQELLNLDADSQRIVESLFPGDMQDAISGIHDLATRARRGDESRSSLSLREYGGRAVEWLSVDAWNDSRIRQAVHDLWVASPLKRPPAHSGMDPALVRPNGEPIRVALTQRGASLEFVVNDRPAGSPFASITTGSRLITVTPADVRDPFWKSGQPPQWASDWGRDEFGAWVEFQIERGAPGGTGRLLKRGWREGEAPAEPPQTSDVPRAPGSARASSSRSEPPAGGVENFSKPITQRMRWIPAGTFQMGSPKGEPGRFEDEGLQHPVTLTRGFWMFDTQVTQELWRAVIGDSPSQFKGDRRPVEQVSWVDVQRFLDRLNARFGEQVFVLPSEAQWEYACRTETTTAYSFGDDPKLLDEHAWYASNSGRATHDVATKKCNAWGLFDMHGNVLEWCQDYWAGKYDSGAVIDPAGPSKGLPRVLRGGSWRDYAQDARSACRYRYDSGDRHYDIGFRCAQVPGGAEPTEEDRGAAEPQACPTNGGGGGRAALKIESGDPARTLIPTRASVIVVCSDVDSLELRKISKPHWASAMGRDRYGLWAEFMVDTVIPDQAPKSEAKLRGKGRKRGEKQAVASPLGTQRPVVQRLRWIPPGRFLMGSPDDDKMADGDEKPQHEVTLSHGYWLFDTPVSQELWWAVMQTNPSHFQSSWLLPVEKVSWDDCQTFLARINEWAPGINLSLPTEAEWEYACRAGTVTDYSFGDDPKLLGDYAWVGQNSGGQTQPVGTKRPNVWGLFDMHGNVWEWCQDYWVGKYASGAVVDPTGPSEGHRRVLRGGGWRYYAQYARSAYRSYSDSGHRGSNIGFRCAQVQQDRKPVQKEGRVSK